MAGTATQRERLIWHGIRNRCNNPNNVSFANYGGRGIYVSEEWATFAQFFADMGPRPSPQHSVDRIDNEGPYAPGNCRWATKETQNRNRRNNINITLDDRTLTLAEWAREIGMDRRLLRWRHHQGWTGAKLLQAPQKYTRRERP